MSKPLKLTPLTDADLHTRYDEALDEVYGAVKVAACEYETSRALKELDPTAYRCGFSDWLDAEVGCTLWEYDGEYYDEDPSEFTDDDEEGQGDV